MHDRHATPRVLLIGGVDISTRPYLRTPNEPLPDYVALRHHFPFDILDTPTMERDKNLFSVLVTRYFGSHWVVAIDAARRARNYDMIIAAGEDVGLPLALLMKIFRIRTPLLLTCHNIATRRPRFYLQTLKVGTAVQSFQCLSRTQAKILVEQAHLRDDQVRLLYWHVDEEFFQPLPDVDMKNQICSAGMSSRDYATLVDASRDLDVDVKIAADSPWFRSALNIPETGLPANVEVRSYENYYKLRQLYAESRVVVVPLLDVPFSAGYTVILEGMAMGKPVIVTKIKQHDDFIVDGWNGFYVPPGDRQALREKISYLIDNPDEAKRMGENARKSVMEKFSLQHFLGRMDQVIADTFAAKVVAGR